MAHKPIILLVADMHEAFGDLLSEHYFEYVGSTPWYLDGETAEVYERSDLTSVVDDCYCYVTIAGTTNQEKFDDSGDLDHYLKGD